MIDLYIVHIKENGPLRFNTYKEHRHQRPDLRLPDLASPPRLEVCSGRGRYIKKTTTRPRQNIATSALTYGCLTSPHHLGLRSVQGAAAT